MRRVGYEALPGALAACREYFGRPFFSIMRLKVGETMIFTALLLTARHYGQASLSVVVLTVGVFVHSPDSGDRRISASR